MLSHIDLKRHLSLLLLLASCLLIETAQCSGQQATNGTSYNPLRSGERPWSRDRRAADAAPKKLQPTPSSPAPFYIPKPPVPQPESAPVTPSMDKVMAAPSVVKAQATPTIEKTPVTKEPLQAKAIPKIGPETAAPKPSLNVTAQSASQPKGAPPTSQLKTAPMVNQASNQAKLPEAKPQELAKAIDRIAATLPKACPASKTPATPAVTVPSAVRLPMVHERIPAIRNPVASAQPAKAPARAVQLIAMQTEPGRAEPVPTPAQRPDDYLAPDTLASSEPAPPMDSHLPLTDVRPQLWQTCDSPYRCGVTCPCNGYPNSDHRWRGERMIPWQIFAQGEYVGPARSAHVPQYHLRVDDIIRMVYGLTGEPSAKPYLLAVGDTIQIESNGDPKINRSVTIQPDGMVTMRYLGQVRAAGLNLDELRMDLEDRFQQYVKDPAVSILPIKLNTRLEELRQSVDQRYGRGGQGVEVRVTPAGTVQLPSIGSIPVQGLTLDEVKREIEARYARRFQGIEVTPVLDQRAPRYLFVLGEVRNPGRFELVGPTTAMQAIAMAGGWNVGAELRQCVVFRRDDCWRLMATKLHLCQAVRGKQPCPPDEIWLRDSDILLVPKSRILETDDAIQLLFTRGLYGVVPLNVGLSWTNLSAL